MATITITAGITPRSIKFTLVEANGQGADLTSATVTLTLTLVVNPYTAITRAVVKDDAPNGKCHYTLVTGDFATLTVGTRWTARYTAVPIPNSSDTGLYPEGDLDIWEIV